jgi:hypothetical protein
MGGAVLRYPDARTRPLDGVSRGSSSEGRARRGHAHGEDEGLPVHDGRILFDGVLGLRVGAAMAKGSG